VPGGGLFQVRPRRHGLLRVARRGQAVSGGGLLQRQLEPTRGSAWRTEVADAASTWAAPRQLLQAARSSARHMAGAGAASTWAVPSPLEATRNTSDELTVLYSNGPDDRSVKLALGYVTAATSGC
jgi:hypothetical protein